MFYVLKSSDVLDVLVPILYFLNDARSDQCTSHIHVVSQLIFIQIYRVYIIFNYVNISVKYNDNDGDY